MDSASDGVRVVIADDHAIFRDGLRRLLEAEGNFSVVGEAADGAEAVKLLHQVKPDVLLLDLSMPKCSGLDALRELAFAPTPAPVHVVVLAAVIEKAQMIEALQLGARGMVLKESSTQALIGAIRSVLAGQYWIGQESVSNLVGALRDHLPSPRVPKSKDWGLTARERKVMEAIVAGGTNRDIAQSFSISEQTVKHHITSIFDKLGVSSRVEVALFAVKHGLVHKD
jgi:two-component system, NarL family, nitrate/nitrite response regulator NarL